MKWFLQFLSIGSVLIYALLIIIDERIPDSAADDTVVSETHAKQRRLSVWDPYLPYRSFGQDRRASLSPEPVHQQNETSKSYVQNPRQFDQQPASDTESNVSELDDNQNGKAALPMPGGSFDQSLEGKEAIWFVVCRAARLHAGPSVSSRITHFYPVGSELKLVRYEQGWFLVSDPTTSRQGWIYERYYLQAIPGPGQTQLAVQDLPNTTRVALEATKLKLVSRVKKPRPQQKITKPSKRNPPRNEFASLIERAFRGY